MPGIAHGTPRRRRPCPDNRREPEYERGRPSRVGKQVLHRVWRDDAEVPVRGERGDAAARRALEVALLDQVRLEHVLDGVGFLAHRVRQVVEPYWAAAELLDHRE